MVKRQRKIKNEEADVSTERYWQYKLSDSSDWLDFDAIALSSLDRAQRSDRVKVEINDKSYIVSMNSLRGYLETDSRRADMIVRKIESGKGDISNGKDESENDEPVTKKITFRGLVPVDPVFQDKHGGHDFVVYVDGNGIAWDCILNQTNINVNNNKFYLIQLLMSSTSPVSRYAVWKRWGRVGANGQTSLTNFANDAESMKVLFAKGFQAKTGNNWPDCRRDNNFNKYPGRYDLVIREYGNDEKKEMDNSVITCVKQDESTLDKRLQSLIEMICNVKAIENTLKELNYDTKRSPLGKLSVEQIKSGYQALKEIESLIQAGAQSSTLMEACGVYYTRIPHDFGRRRPPLMKSLMELKIELTLLEALMDAEAAVKIISDQFSRENIIDQRYHELKCDLVPLEEDGIEFDMVQNALQSTHGETHNHYRLEIIDVFKVNRQGESDRFKDLGKNKYLLWHGSRLTNFAGIISQGLRIAPPEAPVTGYMFGKGVYFADCSSKSSNYCCTRQSDDVGIMLLSEVSLGEIHDEFAAKHTLPKNLPSGMHSVRGVGKMIPDETKSLFDNDGAKLHLGPLLEREDEKKLQLLYNEYIVYDTQQIKIKYLLKLKFKYQK